MKLRWNFLVGLLFACVFPCLSQAFTLERVANTTLQMPANPPVFNYTSTNAFGTMTFTNPVAIVSPPGETNRLFILEKRGRIIAITNLAAPTRTIFMDITNQVLGSDTVFEERGLLGLVFHPGYATNRYFYVYYTGTATTATPGGTNSMHDILARFETSAGNPNQVTPIRSSEFCCSVTRPETTMPAISILGRMITSTFHSETKVERTGNTTTPN
jgi:hypothetical protein